MKTILLDNILSDKELFLVYNQVISAPSWSMNGESTPENSFYRGPILPVKKMTGEIDNFTFCFYGQTLVLRIAKLLQEKNVGIPTNLIRMWFNITNSGVKSQHRLHNDDKDKNIISMVLFLTPIWQPEWRGSFWVDGEEFEFKPGSAVIFNANQYHQGSDVEKNTYNWQRLTCNILVE